MDNKDVSFFEIFESGEALYIKNFDDSDEAKIKLIGNYYFKKIEKNKSSIAKSEITFLEPLAMEYCKRCGLPAPNVIGIEEKADQALFVTERVEGINAYDYVEENPGTRREIEAMCERLRIFYQRCGVERKMDLKDMILVLENNSIKSIVPLDFERIKYNENINWDLVKEIAADLKIDLSEFFNKRDKGNEIDERE